MVDFRKTALASISLSCSVAFAGTMGPVCTAGNVTVPCERNAWNFGVQALYLKAHYNQDLAWYSTTIGNTTRYIGADFAQGWGVRLEGSYHFLTGNDLTLNWVHYSHDSDQSVMPSVRPIIFTLNTDSRWDAVNLELGQHVDFGEFKNIRFHGGFQYARIRTNQSLTVALTNGMPVPIFGSDSHLFTGFGPRAGADLSFDWGNGLGVYAKPAAAILTGSSKYNEAVTAPGTTITITSSRTSLVPEFETKLGATYSYAMAQGNLILDAGWMWVDYLDAHDDLDSNGKVGKTDFAITGPFLGLKWIGSFV